MVWQNSKSIGTPESNMICEMGFSDCHSFICIDINTKQAPKSELIWLVDLIFFHFLLWKISNTHKSGENSMMKHNVASATISSCQSYFIYPEVFSLEFLAHLFLDALKMHPNKDIPIEASWLMVKVAITSFFNIYVKEQGICGQQNLLIQPKETAVLSDAHRNERRPTTSTSRLRVFLSVWLRVGSLGSVESSCIPQSSWVSCISFTRVVLVL